MRIKLFSERSSFDAFVWALLGSLSYPKSNGNPWEGAWGSSTNTAAFGKGRRGPHRQARGRGISLKKRFPFPAIRSALVDPVMAPEAAGVAQGALGDAVGRLAAVEKIHDGLGDGRIFVEVVEMAGKGAQVVKGTVQAAGRAADAHIVPHGIADGRPVLRDERRVVVALVAGAFPVGDGVGKALADVAALGDALSLLWSNWWCRMYS